MKNQQYIERINTIDRYNQKINKVIEEIEIQLTLLAEDREDYELFKKKYMPLITEYLSTSPSMSPSEWKDVVYHITVYYPELISTDGTDEQQLWPWFGVELENGDIVRKRTPFAKNILNTHKSNNSCNLFSCLDCKTKQTNNDIELGNIVE